jgi:hypothetical protein
MTTKTSVILAACLQGQARPPALSITTAESVAAGAFTPPGGKALPNLPAFCRVAGPSSHPPTRISSSKSGCRPPTGTASSRASGNGGFAGYIGYDQLANAVAHNYATAGTDTGHHAGGTGCHLGARPSRKIADFGYRAIHETAVKAKAILHAFYGEAPKRSYFSSCSNGGRQALMEAQRYPEDYDGIIAGAPANYWTHLLANAAWDIRRCSAIRPATFRRRSCPPSSRRAGRLRRARRREGRRHRRSRALPLRSVACCSARPPSPDNCLTAPQVAALKKLYAGGHNSQGPDLSRLLSRRRGRTGGWAAWITGRAPERSLMYAFGTQFFKNMVFDNAAWDYHTFNADRDTKAADDKQAATSTPPIPTSPPSANRGGKLILYHGWSDAAIAPQNTIDYYDSVAAKMGASRRTASCASSWCRECSIAAAAPAPTASASYRPIRRCRSRHGCRAGALGRKRRRPRAHRGRQAQERPRPRQRRRAHAPVVRVSFGRALPGQRQHRRRRQLRVREA